MAPMGTSTGSRDAEAAADQRPPEHPPKERPVDAARRVLRERRWVILAVTLTFTAVAIAFDARTERLYSSTATVEVQATTQEAPLLYRRTAAPDVLPETEAARLGTVILPVVLQDAARR